MVSVSRTDRSSGMFSTTDADAIRPDNRAPDQKDHFLWCMRVKEEETCEAVARPEADQPSPFSGLELTYSQKKKKKNLSL